MNKKILVIGIIAVLVVIGGASLYIHNSKSGATVTTAPVTQTLPQTDTSQTPVPGVVSASSAVSSVPLMQSTGQKFAQYAYVSKAHEIYPTLATDSKKALGAFSFSKTDLGNGVSRITLTNNAEGYKGQSVVVSSDQKVYFIERSTGDDSDTEDSVTTDDILIAVDAQGNILK